MKRDTAFSQFAERRQKSVEVGNIKEAFAAAISELQRLGCIEVMSNTIEMKERVIVRP